MPLLVRNDATAAATDNAAPKQRTAALRSHLAPSQLSGHRATSPPPVRRLFIGGCPPDLSSSQLQDELQRRFQSFGTVSSIDVIKAAEDRSERFAYVDIVSERLPAILSTFRGSQWKGRKFRVEEAKPDYLTRLQQLWAEQAQDGTSSTDGSENGAAAPSAADWSAQEFCFRIRPGLRIRTRPRPPCRSFPHIPALPIHALPQQEEADGEEVERHGSDDGATVRPGSLTAAEQRERLMQWKAEVEQRWLVPQGKKFKVREEPKRVSKREELRLKRQRQQAEAAAASRRSADEEVEEDAAAEIASEEELDTVDFFSDDEEETEETEQLTAEERQQREEEAEWAALEGSDGSEDDASDSQREVLPAAAEQDGLVDDWAELERGGEEAVDEAEEDEVETEAAAIDPQTVREAVAAFPKKSVSEWWNDGDDGEEELLPSGVPSPPSSAASSAAAMSRLSSALLARSEFSVRPAYEGESGQRLLQLKRRYGGDARFALDDRFAVASQQQQEEQEAQQEEPQQPHVEDGKAKEEAEKKQDGSLLDAAALRSALHAETVRSLRLLDEVAPGPTKFHMTLPRFSSAAPVPAADGEGAGQSVEAELDREQARKGVLMWRQMRRFDPELEDTGLLTDEQSLTQPQAAAAAGDKRRREDAGGAVTKERKEDQPSVKRDRKKRKTAAAEEAAAAAEAAEAASGQRRRRTAAPALYEVTVPRLRDLITDPSTVVKFSFAVDGAEAEMMDSNVVVAFPTAPAPASLPPIIPAPVGLPAAASSSRARLAQRRSVQQPPPPPIYSAAALSAPPSSAPISTAQQQQPPRPGKLSDLLAQAQQAYTQASAGVRADAVLRSAAAAAADDDDDGAADGLFMRDGDVAAVESAWRDRRAAIRTEYRKKSRDAVRKEAAKQGPAASAARQPPWKAKRRAEGEGGRQAAEGRQRGSQRGSRGGST